MERETYQIYLDILKELDRIAMKTLRTKFIFRGIPAETYVEVFYLPQDGLLDKTALIDETGNHNIKYFTIENFLEE